MGRLFMKRNERAKEWLKRARSNLARAKLGVVSSDILYEDLCFDAQQAVEKSLKSLCIIHNIAFPKTHDIAYLIDLLKKNGVAIPKVIQKARMLTGYAVETRYPGDYESVVEKKYKEALAIADKVVNWVETHFKY